MKSNDFNKVKPDIRSIKRGKRLTITSLKASRLAHSRKRVPLTQSVKTMTYISKSKLYPNINAKMPGPFDEKIRSIVSVMGSTSKFKHDFRDINIPDIKIPRTIELPSPEYAPQCAPGGPPGEDRPDVEPFPPDIPGL
jgi:hypothetical protein